MRIVGNWRVIALIMGLAFCLWAELPKRAAASVVVALELDELTSQADSALVGRVVGARSERRGTSIVTIWQVAADDVLKGSRQTGEMVEVTTLGGVVDGVGLKVEGEATFTIGERAVVFLKRDARRAIRLVGMAQGAMQVRKVDGIDRVFSNREGLALVRRTAKGLVSAPPAILHDEQLADFTARVREIVATQKGR